MQTRKCYTTGSTKGPYGAASSNQSLDHFENTEVPWEVKPFTHVLQLVSWQSKNGADTSSDDFYTDLYIECILRGFSYFKKCFNSLAYILIKI